LKHSDDITGVVVSYNTKDLLERAYNSVRKFMPEMPIVIVDGSIENSDCYRYVRALKKRDKLVDIFQSGRNLGHGVGMDIGIRRAKTKYILIFDSDIEMMASPIEEMMKILTHDDSIYGVGKIMIVDKKGINIDSSKYGEGIDYLHPYFQMINKSNYLKYHKYIHHGAPCIKTAKELKKKGHSSKLINFELDSYIAHDWRGTRKLFTRRFKWLNLGIIN
jgi:GT2 family glycosyltransferase